MLSLLGRLPERWPRVFRSTLLLLAFIYPIDALSLRAQPIGQSEIRVEKDQPVGSPTDFPLIEPHLTVDPRNPGHLVAAAMARVSPGNQNLGCVVSSSFDGGTSWISTHLKTAGLENCGDPWTAILNDGTALMSFLSTGGIVVLRSPDGGRTWNDSPVRVPGPHDHPMLVIDKTGEIVYLVSALSVRNADKQLRSAVYVAQSADGGRSFAELSRVIISNTSYEALTPFVLSNGELAFGVIDHHDASDRRLERRRAQLLVSSKPGVFGEPMLVTESCSRTRFTSWPSFAVVRGLATPGERLVLTCEAEGNEGILFALSEDRGNRWTSVVRIDGPGRTGAWTKTPTLASSGTGILAVTWLDKGDDARQGCWHLQGTVSLDGGKTFLPPTRLSTEPSCPTAAGTGQGVLDRFPTGGEYHGLVSIGPRQFLAVWPDARDGHFQLRSVRFSVKP